MILGVPTRIGPMLRTPVFGWDAKLRMGLELIVPKRTYAEGEDESIASFFTRRFGDELTDRLAAPLLGGIFAGDAADLSVRATFPQLVEMEQKHGSLLRAMWARAKEMRAAHAPKNGAESDAPKKPPPSMFITLTAGLGRLVEVLVDALQNTNVRTGAGTRVVRARAGGGFDVELDSGEVLEADDVVLTAPAHALVPMIEDLDADLSEGLAALRYASTVTVFLGVRRADVRHELDATGFLVPRSLGRPLLAGTWVSSKWPNRAPPGHALLKAFFGGAWGEGVLDRTDEDLVDLARSELERLMGPIGTPLFSRVYRHRRASPQPVLGHLGHMAAIRARAERFPGLFLAGNGFDGSGIPDCIKQAEAVAQMLLAR
jgi:oxygen-dependent protoporphyrinogen oxidase